MLYEPGEALQVAWGDCGRLTIGQTPRRVSVFVAVLCYSRLCYIEFSLSQRKAEFYRALVHALEFFQGSPRKIIFDNLKAAVHLRRLLGLVRLYGRQEVLAAIGQALQYQTYDAAYVEALLLQERRRRELPSPTPLQPQRRELIEDIHLEEPDPAHYDRLCGSSDDKEPQA